MMNKNYKYSIDLVLKDECNTELAAAEFSKALEFPKKMFQQKLQFMSLRYLENEKSLAMEHRSVLNDELHRFGLNRVEFRIKELF